jgi:lambda family phage portal protein
MHEGAQKGRRLGNWGTQKSSPNQEVTGDLDTLRERSRTLRRDNAWASRGSKVDVASVIGTGIRPVPATNNEEFNKLVAELWFDWSGTVDYLGTQNSIYSMQSIIRTAKREAGEVFILSKNLRIDRNSQSPIPLQFQILESEYCPLHLTIPSSNGNEIRNGIELNPRGQIVAYYFYRHHPSEYNIGRPEPTQFTRVSKDNVMHYYDKERPNQLRGRPLTSNSIVTAKTYDSYTDAELVRKESRSAITGTIEREAYSDADYKFDPMSGEPLTQDASDTPMMNLEAGTFQALLAGEKLNVLDADDTGMGYRDYQVFQLLQIAASHGVPYQLLTGDWQGINDRVWRAIFNQYKREVQQDQELGFMPQICTPMYREFIKRGVVSGALDVSGFSNPYEYYRVDHKTQAFEYIHPEQDINAETKRLKAGLTSRSAIIARRGYHGETIEKIDDERAKDKTREDGLDLKSTANYDVLGDDIIPPEPMDKPTKPTKPTKAK